MSKNEKNLNNEKAQTQLKKLLAQNARGIKLLDSLLGKTPKENKKANAPGGTPGKPKPRKMDPNNKADSANKFIERRRTLGGTKILNKLKKNAKD